jgi:toxin ParE1/3/4
MKYSLHPGADFDLREAAKYYRKHGGNELASIFLNEFERVVHLLLDHPFLGAKWRHGKRRFILKHFPYSVIYSTNEEEIVVLAVAHQSRHSEYWKKRK